MVLLFKTKAETLEQLENKIQTAIILPQIRFTEKEWNSAGVSLLNYSRMNWLKEPVIVRSSSFAEDSESGSMAGHYTSVLNVIGECAIIDAVNKVIASFDKGHGDDQVFIQPMVKNVFISGVAFTRDPNNNTPYYVVNYDFFSKKTDTVTSGLSNLNTFYKSKFCEVSLEKWKHQLIELCKELEILFDNDALDIEFAIDCENRLYLLQVRPLIVRGEKQSENVFREALCEIENKVCSTLKPHPYLLGKNNILGVMPDWNPAEIIGMRPKPLALSLYKELVTDNIWAYQRNNYGYRNLRSFPLLLNLKGLPYIDARVSFNSFIPADLPEDIASVLADYYIDKLRLNPHQHDKVEFEIVYSCYPFDIDSRLKALKEESGLTDSQLEIFTESLRNLTNGIIKNDGGLWQKDILKIEKLKKRQEKILNSDLSDIDKIYWLLEDCKRYGTLPFAGLARAGFIAVQLLKSMVNVGVITQENYEFFMNSLETVSSKMGRDKEKLSKNGFLSNYGFLRPGTYDICSPRYDEKPDFYFKWNDNSVGLSEHKSFFLSLNSMNGIQKLLDIHKIDHDVLSLLNFLKGAIEGREYAKFVFTKSLSDVLDIFKNFGEKNGYDRSDLAFSDIDIIKKLYSSADTPGKLIEKSISAGKESFEITKMINLPPVITNNQDIFCFEYPVNKPNFITQKRVSADIIKGEINKLEDLNEKIVIIPSADPGYDWLFTHNIAGLITKYGGINSHMAVRACEMGIPSVIGCGEVIYEKVNLAETIFIDCENQKIDIIKNEKGF